MPLGHTRTPWLILLVGATLVGGAGAAENWPQLKYDARHSGNIPERNVSLPLGLVAAVPLSDAVFTSPVVADGRLYVVDGSGVALPDGLAALAARDEGKHLSERTGHAYHATASWVGVSALGQTHTIPFREAFNAARAQDCLGQE